MLIIVLCLSEVDFFFYKQKTAYEMRMSDWSSDGCSSDLPLGIAGQSRRRAGKLRLRQGGKCAGGDQRGGLAGRHILRARRQTDVGRRRRGRRLETGKPSFRCRELSSRLSSRYGPPRLRSEEHQSELQSLMRNTYDVI